MELRQKASFEPNEKMPCLFWNSLAILKIIMGFVVDEFSKFVHTIRSQGSLSDCRGSQSQTKCLALKLVHRIPTESHIETC